MNEEELNQYFNDLENHFNNLNDLWDFINEDAPPDCEISLDHIISLTSQIQKEIGYRILESRKPKVE